MKYTVQISELLSHKVVVEAESAESARQKVEDDYYNCDLVLSADDYVDGSVQFEVVDEINTDTEIAEFLSKLADSVSQQIKDKYEAIKKVKMHVNE